MRTEANPALPTVAVIGGCGHVGLPLGVKLQLAGHPTVLLDVNEAAVRVVQDGRFPFLEEDGDRQLRSALEQGLEVTSDTGACAKARIFVFVTGTPVDEHLNPRLADVLEVFDAYRPYLRPGSLVIMRSTLYPGTMSHLHDRLGEQGPDIRLAFCPERVSQGFGLREIDSLPQIVSAFDEASFEAARALFARLAPCIIRLEPLEAEITKLMANAWRYLEFAIPNQFYMIAEANGVDFHKIYAAIRHDYPRADGYKAPGFAAGPCLFKDTMQLASFHDNQFYLGHAAMLVNEGLGKFVVKKLERALKADLAGKTVGLLGLTFKPDCDDVRDSLSFRVKKILEFEGARVLANDPYIRDSTPLETLEAEADAFILCTPHREYRGRRFSQPVVDVWGSYDRVELDITPGTRTEAT